jgi:L-cysteine:1D-myo-inositol 2-amino-2-deoxy-alpha-D-glucopyranoside ligase
VFARIYAHSGLVSYQGEKMSKSLGNLVFVSRLLADGVDPMAIRLALLAHHYRSEWEWTDEGLAEAAARLYHWREALARAEAPVPAGTGPHTVLVAVREAMSDDLDAPRALAAIDRWADAVLSGEVTPSRDAELIRQTADALLGVAL